MYFYIKISTKVGPAVLNLVLHYIRFISLMLKQLTNRLDTTQNQQDSGQYINFIK